MCATKIRATQRQGPSESSDYATALARLEGYNRAELDFFARLPPIFASMPKPILAATGAA